jgi:hypothetical protein
VIILTGQQLVNAVRKEADKIKKRLWIAVPFIGSQNSGMFIIRQFDLKNDFNFEGL